LCSYLLSCCALSGEAASTNLEVFGLERQHNGQKKKDKKTNNDLQNTTQKGKDRAARNPLKTGGEPTREKILKMTKK
jgi:hypothetical protein